MIDHEMPDHEMPDHEMPEHEMPEHEVTDHEVTDHIEATSDDIRRKLVLLGGLAALLAILAAGYFVWAQARASEDLADRNARA